MSAYGLQSEISSILFLLRPLDATKMFLKQCLLLILLIARYEASVMASNMASKASNMASNLPFEKFMVAYQSWSECDENVFTAVEKGVNVVIWFATNLVSDSDGNAAMVGGPNRTCVEDKIAQLGDMGYGGVKHLISVGGWDASHPNTTHSGESKRGAKRRASNAISSHENCALVLSYKRHLLRNQRSNPHPSFQPFSRFASLIAAEEYAEAFETFSDGLYDGLDWDLEGNDALTSPWNYFSRPCLDLMADLSKLLHDKGYIVSMAPPESYLDIQTTEFSKFVNLTYPSDDWDVDPPFSYHGHNTYGK